MSETTKHGVDVAAIAFVLMAVAAALPLFGFDVGPLIWFSTGPAAVLYFIGDALGLSLSYDGVLIGHAHGPPFLRPTGVLLIYGVPAMLLVTVRLRKKNRGSEKADA